MSQWQTRPITDQYGDTPTLAKLAANFNAKMADLRPATCLLSTSDAADERPSVDLGGRRIIKKKKKKKKGGGGCEIT